MGTFPARLSFSCNSRVEIAGQTGSFARRIVEWRLQHAFEVACDESAPMRFGRQIQFLARAVEDVREPATPPVARHRAGARDLGGGGGGFENRSDRSGDRLHRRQPSAFTAASTSSTCPGTLTLRHTLASVPDTSNSQVVRSIPLYSRPYSTLGTHAPNASITPFSSLASGTVRRYFAVNLACLAGASFDTPSKAAPALANSAAIALKSWASLVQPAVSSFG